MTGIRAGNNFHSSKGLRKFTTFLIITMILISIPYIGLNGFASSPNTSQLQTNSSIGNITFTGNVTNDFKGHLIYYNKNSTYWGSGNNLTSLYVAFNSSDLFIGVQEIISNNGLIIAISNNTDSSVGTSDMATLNAWTRSIIFDSPINLFSAVWFSGNDNSNYTGNLTWKITSPLNQSDVKSNATPIYSTWYISGKNDSVEVAIPLNSIFMNYTGNLSVGLAVLLVGGSSSWVGTAMPYDQQGPYNTGNTYFVVNATINVNINKVTFSEKGLPQGTKWSVKLSNGQTFSSNQSLLMFNVKPGNYGYSVYSSNINFIASKPSGSINVGKTPVILYENFLRAFNITFIEFGLPQGTRWYVNLSNSESYNSNIDTITILEPNGTYSYSIASSNKDYAPTPSSGSITVNGSSKNVIINFSLLTYRIEFNESGLPPNTLWYVNLSNGFSGKSNSSSISFNLPNGTYSYQISVSNKSYIASLSQGNFSVEGKPVFINITFLRALFKITFSEMGLPNGTKWFVNLSTGQNFSSSNTSILFFESNGSYKFTVASSNKIFFPIPSTGEFNVSGNNVLETIIFAEKKYNVTFEETGLPAGKLWYVNLSNGMSSGKINSSSFTFSLPNGSYSFNVFTSFHIYKPMPSSGNLTVNGKGLDEYILFNKVLYEVEFNEVGLPMGNLWYVNLSNNENLTSYSTRINFNETNGSYGYKISTSNKSYLPFPSSGSFIVNGSNVMINISFTLITFYVNFTETGLPSGTIWFLNLSNGQSFSSHNNFISFKEPNGIYHYNVSTANKDYKSSNGVFIVNGSNMNISIIFSPVLYQITFSETGLSSGTVWEVTFNGKSENSTSSNIIFYATNGTYSYSIGIISGYKTSNYSGLITVNGMNQIVSVKWNIVTYVFEIIESGIPNGTLWSVTITGRTFTGQYINLTLNSTTNVITFTEPNGTYSYIIHLPTGYSGNNLTGTLSISGQNVSIPITSSKISSPSYSLEIYAAIVIAIVIVVVAVLLLTRARKPKNKK